MSSRDINRPLPLTAAILISIVGMSALHVQPLLVGAAVDHLGFSNSQAGLMAGLEMLGIAFSAALSVLWIRRVSWQRLATVAILVTLAGNLLSATITDFELFVVIRLLVGLCGEGIALAVGVAMISEAKNSDRAFSFMVMGYVLQMIAGLLLLPYLIEPYGMAGAMIPLAVFVGFCLLAPTLAPERATTVEADPEAALQGNGPVFWGLAAQLVWYMGVAGALWAFIERIGAAAGFAGTDIGSALALAMGLSFFGAALATALADRFGKLKPFLLTMVVQGITVLALFDVSSLLVYAVAWCVINVVWNFGLPYMYAAVADADYSGRFVIMIPTGQNLGSALGAALGGFLVVNDNFAPMLGFAVGCCVVAGLLFATMVRRTRAASVAVE